MSYKTNIPSFFHFTGCLIFIIVYTSCGSTKALNTDYVYFKNGKDTVTAIQKETVIQPNDLLSIQVFSKMQNQEQAIIFNIPQSANNPVPGYQVNASGEISMPIIGNIKASGLSKDQLQSLVEQRLATYVKSPSVIVRFLEFTVSILGEVRSPGTRKFSVDRVTIIDAISAAGDLTDFGKREDITVIREEGGKKIYFKVDLRNRNLFESKVYMLQPNDIVYVSPNKYKLKNISVDPDVQRRMGLLFSVTSLILGVATFLITTLR